jgi:hypothetical protein
MLTGVTSDAPTPKGRQVKISSPVSNHAIHRLVIKYHPFECIFCSKNIFQVYPFFEQIEQIYYTLYYIFVKQGQQKPTHP